MVFATILPREHQHLYGHHHHQHHHHHHHHHHQDHPPPPPPPPHAHAHPHLILLLNLNTGPFFIVKSHYWVNIWGPKVRWPIYTASSTWPPGSPRTPALYSLAKAILILRNAWKSCSHIGFWAKHMMHLWRVVGFAMICQAATDYIPFGKLRVWYETCYMFKWLLTIHRDFPTPS